MAEWKHRYAATASESDVAGVLAQEFAAYGLTVRPEVNCVLPLDGSGGKDQSRRVDLWAARAPKAGGWSPIASSDAWVRTLAPGGVVAVELKFEEDRRHWKHWRVCMEQAKSAMRAHDWWVRGADGRKHAVARPSVVLCADNWTLSGAVTEADVGEMDRALWANGCAILYREGESGGLYWRMHVGRQDVRVRLRVGEGGS